MAEDPNELIEVDLSDPPKDVKAPAQEVKVAEATPPKDVEVEEGVEALKQKLAAADARTRAAEERASSAEGRVAQAETVVDQTNLSLVTGAISALNDQKANLKARYAEALAADDFAGAAEIQDQMSIANGKLQQLEQGKIAIETAPKREAIRQARASGDPVETLAASMEARGAPKSAAWVRAHPEFVGRGSELEAAHNLAVARGHAVESDGYFAEAEKILGVGYNDGPRVEATSGAAKATGGRSAAPPAAPVTRNGNGTGSSNPNRVTLTRAQLEAAEASGQTPKQYYDNMMVLKKEGRLN